MNVIKQCRDMSADERLAWGIEESRIRQEELRDIRSAEALEQAQNNAEARRKLIGASRSAASAMVIEANRHLRLHGGAS